MKLTVTSCLLLWNFIAFLAEAGEPMMESTRHIKVSVIQGNSVILPCLIDFEGVEDRDKYTVIWSYKNGRILTTNEKVQGNRRKFQLSYEFNEWNLQISNVRKTDSGEYKCQVNSNPVQTKTVVLVVSVPPRIYSSEMVEVNETKRLVIYCNVTGDPPPSVSWYRDKEKLTQYSGEMLVIDNTSRNDSGIYTCKAENGIHPSDSEDITVDVLYAPTVHLSTDRISQYRHKSVVLDCHVTANPVEEVTWYKNANELVTNWKYKLEKFAQSDGSWTHSLEIRKLGSQDFGDYICRAKNKVGNASQIVTVIEITDNIDRTTKKPVEISTTPSEKDLVKTSSSKISLSSTSDSVSYIPVSSPRNGELVVVPDNASTALCSKNSLVLLIVVFISLCV